MSIRTQIKNKLEKQAKRQRRVRATISGTAARPRLCVFRSNSHISAQLIDDQKGLTLAVCDDKKIAKTKPVSKDELSGKQARAFAVGMEIAQKALAMKTKQVVFDRAGYRYHGRIKSLAEGARKGGLEF